MLSLSSPSFSRASSSGSSIFNNIPNPRSSSRLFSGKASTPVVILPKSEYERIKSAAVVIPRDQRFKMQEEIIKDRLRDKQRERTNGTSDKVETLGRDSCGFPSNSEESKKREALLEKLKQQRIEQDDDMKKTEEMIREVKCLAVRENQILEKESRLKTAKKQEQDLERKLTESQLALDRKFAELEAKRKLEQKRHAEVMKQQMDEHLARKTLAEKRLRDWEALEIQRKVDQFKQQKMREKLRKMEQQQKLKDGLEKCVLEKNSLKKQLREQEIKQQETLQKQQVSKELFEASVQEEREKRERLLEARSAFISELWSTNQEGSKLSNDAKFRQEREELDRLWRKNELESALKSFQDKESLRRVREYQVTEKAKERAADSLRRRKEHQEIIEADKRALEIERLMSEQRRLQGLKYMSEIQKQILENEERRQHLRKEMLNDARNYQRTIAEHERQIEAMKAKKLQELKALNLPEKYLKEVIRKAKIPWDDITL